MFLSEPEEQMAARDIRLFDCLVSFSRRSLRLVADDKDLGGWRGIGSIGKENGWWIEDGGEGTFGIGGFFATRHLRHDCHA